MRNSIFADHYSDRPYADFSYCDEGLSRFEYAIFPHSGNAEESGVQYEALKLNNAMSAVPSGYHKGVKPQKSSFISVDRQNVVLTAMKFAEDGSGDVILRFSEVEGRDCKAGIMCGIIDAGFYADFKGMEIKTFRINSEGFVKETDFLE